MQRQKTIAKWLAIILLLTAVIACYIAFSAIIKNKDTGSDIAGGADVAGDNKPAVTPPQSDDTPPEPQPVYSEFPRLNEQIDGLTVRHIGGEGNDVLLDSVYFANRRHVIFYSASTQYDVKECGIHIATLSGDCLLSVTKIADVDETFVCASIVQNGLLVITKNAAQTRLRLLDSSCKVIGENACALYSSYKLYVTSAGARLYASDARYLYAFTVTRTLDVIRSNFVFPMDSAEILYTSATEAQDILFVQAAQGIAALSFNASIGFDCRSEIINCRLMQILPHSANGKLNYIVLAKSNEGVLVTSLDNNLAKSDSYLFKNAERAVAAYGDGSNICVIADDTKAVFCSHLELQSTAPLQFDGKLTGVISPDSGTVNSISLTYSPIATEKDMFIVSSGNTHCVVKLSDNTLTTVFMLEGKSVKTVREPLINGESKLSVLFDATAANDFTKMCFGANDVFYVTLP